MQVKKLPRALWHPWLCPALLDAHQGECPRRLERLSGAAALALLSVGCAGKPTPCQLISSSSQVAGGYSETRLAVDHLRVKFAGNRFTSCERVGRLP